ncbi:hypothetical protein BS78_10G180500 [Paspalum vaginatum]|nr:hypothetical protein BS78_10G180500 [Paspalum vaginatum]
MEFLVHKNTTRILFFEKYIVWIHWKNHRFFFFGSSLSPPVPALTTEDELQSLSFDSSLTPRATGRRRVTEPQLQLLLVLALCLHRLRRHLLLLLLLGPTPPPSPHHPARPHAAAAPAGARHHHPLCLGAVALSNLHFLLRLGIGDIGSIYLTN